MPAKVFISCGQATPAEKEMANKLKEWFEDPKQGYTAYVATAIPTIPELNTEILSHLKSSDYYLFINLEREEVKPRDPTKPVFRKGSVYTNQELAVALAFGFDKLILLNQESVRAEGILAYMVVNTETFNSISEVFDRVIANVSKSGWENTFSRHLTINEIVLHNEIVGYGDHTTFDQQGYPSRRPDRIAHVELRNGRPDVAAIDCAMRLLSIQKSGLSKQNNFDQGRLKAMGRLGYDQAIWPKSSGSFDLFGIHANHPHIYLHSENDILPRTPIIREFGSYTLTYEIYATAFPKLTFEVHLDFPHEYYGCGNHGLLGEQYPLSVSRNASSAKAFAHIKMRRGRQTNRRCYRSVTRTCRRRLWVSRPNIRAVTNTNKLAVLKCVAACRADS